MQGRSLRENREISGSAASAVGKRSASGRRGVQADDARAGEVRPLHKSEETGEQPRATGGGVGRAKGGGRGEHAPASGTRLPGSASGACAAGPCFPRSPPFTRPTPSPVGQGCSPVSSLLWRGLTSPARASSAWTPRLPDADPLPTAQVVKPEISRFSRNERPYMPGSKTAQGRADARTIAPVRVAFR
jgi:hypothetical protein